jgi:hypothetical protein
MAAREMLPHAATWMKHCKSSEFISFYALNLARKFNMASSAAVQRRALQAA